MKAGSLDDLKPGEFNIVLGSELAHGLGAYQGDKVVLIAPQGQVTPAGILPRLKQFTVSGIFEVGMPVSFCRRPARRTCRRPVYTRCVIRTEPTRGTEERRARTWLAQRAGVRCA